MAAGAVRVRGLRELSRDFKRMSKDLSDDLTDALKEAADPVKETAQHLALSEIENMPASPHWARMRIGVSRAQGTVYMVPAARRRSSGRSRPNLATLLLDRSMDPALDKHSDEVVDRVDKMLGDLAGANGF